ncbi:MAG: hypothetical protein ACJ75J_04620 [Cytophagaceae bacterium]
MIIRLSLSLLLLSVSASSLKAQDTLAILDFSIVHRNEPESFKGWDKLKNNDTIEYPVMLSTKYRLYHFVLQDGYSLTRFEIVSKRGKKILLKDLVYESNRGTRPGPATNYTDHYMDAKEDHAELHFTLVKTDQTGNPVINKSTGKADLIPFRIVINFKKT